jgi:hypothetical protein
VCQTELKKSANFLRHNKKIFQLAVYDKQNPHFFQTPFEFSAGVFRREGGERPVGPGRHEDVLRDLRQSQEAFRPDAGSQEDRQQEECGKGSGVNVIILKFSPEKLENQTATFDPNYNY